jgi:hypothetical protein
MILIPTSMRFCVAECTINIGVDHPCDSSDYIDNHCSGPTRLEEVGSSMLSHFFRLFAIGLFRNRLTEFDK